jgi:hypothetical protein
MELHRPTAHEFVLGRGRMGRWWTSILDWLAECAEAFVSGDSKDLRGTRGKDKSSRGDRSDRA